MNTKTFEYKPCPKDAHDLFTYNKDTGHICWKDNGERVTTKDAKGYIVVSISGSSSVKAHRLAWFMHYGEEASCDIDHIDGNKSNNAIANLRLANRSLNMQNQTKAKANAPTKYIGVGINLRSKNKPFRAQITIDKKQIYLGCFETAEQASEAYQKAKLIYHR